ncbi:MAG: putative toxin-antitoxin system toxin component, PIN family [Nitrospirae bacterium]|nr:putative toxin-antitoxin system toxin component, PIN family [Nitrospirota bacterium]
MLKIVIDTSIIISGVVYGGKPYDILELAIDKNVLNVVSLNILNEIEGVLVNKFAWQPEKALGVIKWVIEFSELINPTERLNVLDYDNDNRILECAVAGKVQAIVTGDKKHLLPLRRYRDILILSAGDFLSWGQ